MSSGIVLTTLPAAVLTGPITVAAGSSHNHTISGASAAGSSHNHTISGSSALAGTGTAFSIIPTYITTKYIMRIK